MPHNRRTSFFDRGLPSAVCSSERNAREGSTLPITWRMAYVRDDLVASDRHASGRPTEFGRPVASGDLDAGKGTLVVVKSSAGHRRRPPSRPNRCNSRLRHALFECLEERRLLSINVTLYRYDAVGSGVDPNETVLTPANVVASSFGKQFTTTVDGQVLAQPLYMSGVNITAGPYARHAQRGFRGHRERQPVCHRRRQRHGPLARLFPHRSTVRRDHHHGSVSGESTPATSRRSSALPARRPSTPPRVTCTSWPRPRRFTTADTADPHYVNTLYKVNISSGTYTNTVIADTTYSSNGTYPTRTTAVPTCMAPATVHRQRGRTEATSTSIPCGRCFAPPWNWPRSTARNGPGQRIARRQRALPRLDADLQCNRPWP